MAPFGWNLTGSFSQTSAMGHTRVYIMYSCFPDAVWYLASGGFSCRLQYTCLYMHHLVFGINFISSTSPALSRITFSFLAKPSLSLSLLSASIIPPVFHWFLSCCKKFYHCWGPLFNNTSKTAVIWFLQVLRWAMDVTEVMYYIHGQMEDNKEPNHFCCFICVTEQWALTVIKLLRFLLY